MGWIIPLDVIRYEQRMNYHNYIQTRDGSIWYAVDYWFDHPTPEGHRLEELRLSWEGRPFGIFMRAVPIDTESQ